MSRINYHKKVHEFLRNLNSNAKPYFFNGSRINPLRVLPISQNFSGLNLREEDLLLVYSEGQSLDTPTLLVTDKYVRLPDFELPLRRSVLEDPRLGNLSPAHMGELKKLIEIFELSEREERKTLDSFAEKFKSFINIEDDKKQDFVIDYEYLEILKSEGTHIIGLAEDLNADKSFTRAINDMVSHTGEALEFSAEHVILQDIIKIFNLVQPLNNASDNDAEVKIKFALAYFFEKLQGNDLIKSLSLVKINDFVKTESFHKNIDIIKGTNLFDLGEAYQKEFLLPSVLGRLEHRQLLGAGVFLNRIAQLITKADGTVSNEETEILKEIHQKVTNPKEA